MHLLGADAGEREKFHKNMCAYVLTHFLSKKTKKPLSIFNSHATHPVAFSQVSQLPVILVL
jgi:hypothetical protein